MIREDFFQSKTRSNIGLPVNEIEKMVDKAGELVVLARAAEYLRSLTKGHPNLGREGPICPYLELAMSKNLVRLAVYEGKGVIDLIRALADEFENIETERPQDRIFRNITIVLPGRTLGEIEGIQRALKPEFIKKGLMLGEFHPLCGVSGIHSESFKPLQSPDPMLSVRQMVQSDIAFLTGHPTFIRAYLDNFSSAPLSAQQQELVAEASKRFGFNGAIPHAILSKLLSEDIYYEVHDYKESSRPFLRQHYIRDLADITKSIAVEIEGKEAICVLQFDQELDLNRIGARLVPDEEIESRFGEPKNGLSPIGKKTVLIDPRVLYLAPVFVGSGIVGKDIEIDCDDLVKVTKGKIQELSL